MDGFWNKLDNLAYELFGVVLPGLVASVLLLMLWYALGPLIPLWSFEYVPELTNERIRYFVRVVPFARECAAIIGTLLTWYFLGHVLNWVSKGRSSRESAAKELKRVWSFLRFRVQKPTEPFDAALKDLFAKVSKKFSPDRDLSWREFYPLAKNFLVNADRRSLLSTYQNKYTLHRSIAAAAAATVWLTSVGIVAARVTYYLGATTYPNWLMLWVLLLASFATVWGFSATFMFYWTLWGDTIVTESYGALFGVGPRATDGTEK